MKRWQVVLVCLFVLGLIFSACAGGTVSQTSRRYENNCDEDEKVWKSGSYHGCTYVFEDEWNYPPFDVTVNCPGASKDINYCGGRKFWPEETDGTTFYVSWPTAYSYLCVREVK